MTKLLADTSIWIEYFKGNKKIISIIHDTEQYEVYLTGPVLTELVQGIKTQNEKDRLAMCLNALPKLSIKDKDCMDAGYSGNALLKKGITVPVIDLIIYTVAKNNNCVLFSLDKHFVLMKKGFGHDMQLLSPQEKLL